MPGFDPKWRDPPDYILGVTKEIWEDRGISTLTGSYADDIVVRSPASVVIGNANVIGATMATLAEFPDRQLLGEDVIWCEAPSGGFLSSHRLISTATHMRPGAYGPATGKTLRYRIIADCHAVDNQINDEWLIRDQGAIVRQIGMEPKDFARDMIHREGGPERCVQPLTPANDAPGPYAGSGNDDEWGARAAQTISAIMDADFTAIPRAYDRAAFLSYPGGENALSYHGADQFWMGLRASFPNATFTIHHQIGRTDPDMPPRASVRWSLFGKHDGWGRFGTPTGAEVYVLGLTHFEFGAVVTGEPRIRREFTLFDETAIWKQILLQTGDL
ncbi:ester cyclase [Pacificoceanicola onchidii]|uniref:nuclear transport factor 2 family protein n=1 Tax=Pacificoceanicola onchidii TaxID=2562685 RepID=UPI0010A4A0D4|nr:ester cyclase [Pacificoceanicola onchidii]